MKANSNKSKQGNKAAHRVIAGVLCGASVLSLVLSLVMPPISQAIANDAQPVSTEKTVMGGGSSSESTDVDNTTNRDTDNQNSDAGEGDEAGDGAAEMAPLSDDAEAEGAAQPVDDGADDENATAPASVNANDYIEIQGDVTGKFNNGGNYCLTGDAWSSAPITISHDTTIDLACYKLYYNSGNSVVSGKDCSFITVSRDATLTVKGKADDSKTEAPSVEPGQPAQMQFINGSVPQSLTYYVTESTPNDLGTSEKTYLHTVKDFGAIVACKEGYVNQVISVANGGTLNLNGGMIATPRTLGNDGHVIFSQGTVNISGGYVTNGNGGGWGGGLCMATGSLNMTGGVIAANRAAAGGGVFANFGATLNLAGGIITGNATYEKAINNLDNTDGGGYGGGVYTKGAKVTISGSACITNNRVNDSVTENLYNNGLLGGGGIACTHGGTLSIANGLITANYSHEAGGGVYAGFHNQPITFSMTGGTIAGNVSANAEGGGLRISKGTTGDIGTESGTSNKVYITNNKTMTGESRGGDWGGGGVFVQAAGTLKLRAALVTKNEAGGWGGGVGACPTGETIVSHSNGAAIYNNADNGEHFSAGGHDKNLDKNTNYITSTFKEEGHKDYFLVRNDDSQNTVAVVLGKMLGGGSAGWKGTCDREKITIDANGGAEAKYMFGLEAHPSSDAINKAQEAATTIISGNYSYTHGGGIMTNGDLIVGEVNDLRVYPSMKLKATKALVNAKGDKQPLNGHGYKFKLLRKDGTTEPSWKDDDTFDMGDCSVAGEATVNQSNGNITFDSGKDYSSGQYVFYLVEEPISGDNELDTKFDKTIYKIVVKVGDRPSETKYLMSYPINYYKVEGVTVSKKAKQDKDFKPLNSDSGDYSVEYSEDKTTATVAIGNKDNPTFTNKIVHPVSWTPKATKVVEGGEMKEFTLQLAKDSKFQNIIGTAVTSGDDKGQTLSFKDVTDKNKTVELTYSLSDIRNNSDSGDSTGGPSKTFKYYVCEKGERSTYPHYKFDQSVYELTVVAKDDDAGITANVTYTKIVDAEGKEIPEDKRESKLYGEDASLRQSLPTFTNTYSTSLPLSGMSGVTLTYLAGAAVLCAAAAWMHIRRKANAKGGERRE